MARTKSHRNREETIDNPMFLTIAQMSRRSGIGENTLRELIENGKIAYIAIGRRKLLAEQAMCDFYEQNKTAGAAIY